jgi:cysteine desulfurase family protein
MPIYLDNAATSFPKPEEVYRAMDHFLREVGVSPGRGGHRQGLEAARLVFAAREAVAEFFGIADSSRVVFTHSATEALNLAVTGLLRPGDHVLSTTMEHNSLVRPLHRAAGQGVEVSWLPADREGFVTPSQVAAALRPATRLVALAHCSNVTGTVQPVAEIGALCRARGVPLLVDAAQSAGSLPIDVVRDGVDLLAAPGHKGLLGPTGTGFLFVAPGIGLEPLLVGGTGSSSASPEQPAELPERFESGTLNAPGIAGLKAGIDFIRETGIETIARRERALVEQLLAGLATVAGVTLYGPSDPARRGGVVSFTVADADPSELGYRLSAEYDIAVRTGLHCAPDAHRTIGTFPRGTVRVSPGFFTTETEIECFLQAVQAIIEK